MKSNDDILCSLNCLKSVLSMYVSCSEKEKNEFLSSIRSVIYRQIKA